MRTEITYIAYDDTEFDRLEMCVRYEDYARDMMNEFLGCDFFYNDNKWSLTKGNNLETLLGDFELMYQKVEKIIVYKDISSSAETWLINYYGFIDFPTEVGTYEYCKDTGDWIKTA